MNTKEIKLTIVEEDTIFVEVLKQMAKNIEFEGLSLSVDAYTDGQGFLLSKPEVGNVPHLIIMNDILSKRSGVNVTHTLRQLPDTNRFYIILLTQGRSENEMVHALKTGVDYYYQRPVNLRALQATLERILERQAYD